MSANPDGVDVGSLLRGGDGGHRLGADGLQVHPETPGQPAHGAVDFVRDSAGIASTAGAVTS
jgi:hypothetical protein